MELRDYQKEISASAVALLHKYKIAYLSMQVRTGKTITALQTAKDYGAKNILFVTKLKAISSIESDAALLFMQVDVINYEQLHNVTKEYDLLILDEAHCLGQFPKPAFKVQLLKEFCENKAIIFLSGTPTPETYAQIYHQLYVSNYSPFANYLNFYRWHKDYGIPKKKFVYNRELVDYSHVKQDDIINSIKHLMISYTQEEAGFQSFVEEKIIILPMPSKVKWSIEKIKKDKVIITKEGNEILADTAVKEMNKIHQICSGTVKCEDGNAIVFDDSKAQYIKENFKGKKIAIFYKYIAEGMQLRFTFAGRIYDDAMAFNNADNDAVFISQIQSGREGINLSSADALIMYNIDYSAVSYWQSRARMQTKDRDKESIVYWLFTKGGIEEKIYNVVQSKKDFTLSHYKKSI